MREIKFRAWNKHFTEMIYNFNAVSHGECNYFQLSDTAAYFEYDNLMQYTGLKDKNGKEIYEGDIVKVHSNLQNEKQYQIKKVKWYDAGAAFKIVQGKRGLKCGLPVHAAVIYNRKIEIIGNIWENPELLK